MAEEWGTVVIKAPDEIIGMLTENGNAADVVKELSQIGEIAHDSIQTLNYSIGELEIKSGYAKFDFDCSEWKTLSGIFVKDAKNLEWYSRIVDEYGTTDFFLLNTKGERFNFSFDQGGDMCEIEGYEDEVMEKIDKWTSMLPGDLKSQFPDFIDTDDIEFDGP